MAEKENAGGSQQQADHPITAISRSPDFLFRCLVLRLQVAAFAAGVTIVDAVFTQPDVIHALAETAIPIAAAAPFRLVTNHALEFLGHTPEIIANSRYGQITDGTGTREHSNLY